MEVEWGLGFLITQRFKANMGSASSKVSYHPLPSPQRNQNKMKIFFSFFKVDLCFTCMFNKQDKYVFLWKKFTKSRRSYIYRKNWTYLVESRVHNNLNSNIATDFKEREGQVKNKYARTYLMPPQYLLRRDRADTELRLLPTHV